jgi:capsule biosynthesis phosphatase
MKYIVLCGGIGKRNKQYSLPKPLNYIHGKHLIEYIIESIPSNEIYIVYNVVLDDYNFKEIVINKFKSHKIFFSRLDFLTRGAVETALVGIRRFNLNNDNILFIDNDNFHEIPQLDVFTTNFIGYGIDYEKENYSFVTINDNRVINIEEKIKISDNYCCGLYGFVNVHEFMELAEQLINNNLKTKNEFYFSELYKLLINNNKVITPFFVNTTIHLGSYDEMMTHSYNISKKKLRICFDLDNTLVTYPTTPGDYSTVKPIEKNIKLLNDLKNDGHEIIIHTARRMLTHKNNIGKVIKDIGVVTFDNLEKFNIHYDELIFGKPIADIYIDDRALNPYYNDPSMFGLFYKNQEFIQNKIDPNKYNEISKKDDVIIKSGPSSYLRGELFFYQNIPSEFLEYFPKLIDYNKINESIELKLEFINGIPLYYLYKSNTLTTSIIDKLFDILDKFHSYKNDKVNITPANIDNNYFKKLHDRFNKNDYYFHDSETIFNSLLKELRDNYDPIIVDFVHGDFWFSNIILTYEDTLKCIDMKGQVDHILTTCGDIYYDYGKFYQSILGYDLILHNDDVNYNYVNMMKEYFIFKCEKKNLNMKYLTSVTKSLIFGTFHSLKPNDSKCKIWEFIKTIK